MFPCIRAFCRLHPSTFFVAPCRFIPASAPHFPRLSNLCLQSPIPPRIHCQAWQRGGVGAECGAKTRNSTHRACGKWSPSGDMGEAMGCRTDPVVSCLRRRAGCACAAHKGAENSGCVGIVRRMGKAPEGQNLPSGSPERAVPMSKRRWDHPETGEQHPPSRPLQRDPSRRQKPLNGVLKGAAYTISIEAALSAPSEMLFETPRAAQSLRGYWCGNGGEEAKGRRAVRIEALIHHSSIMHSPGRGLQQR